MSDTTTHTNTTDVAFSGDGAVVQKQSAVIRIRCESVSFGYNMVASDGRTARDTASRMVLRNINCEIQSGELVCVVGANGAGKSTLAKLLAGILRPTDGRIISSASEVNYMSQHSDTPQHLHLSVRDIVAMGCVRPGRLFLSRENKHAVDAAMERCGITALAHRCMAHLSGGQKQRAMFARFLTSKADFYILDEPTVALDAVARDSFCELLASIKSSSEDPKAMMLVTHDATMVSQLADVVFCLTDAHDDADYAMFLNYLDKTMGRIEIRHLHKDY